MNYSVEERKILRDNKSGSSEILISVLNYNQQYLITENSDRNSLGHLLKFNRAVIDKFSPMVIVTNGLNRVNQVISKSISENKSCATVSKKLVRFIKEITKIDSKIVKNCSDLFTKGKGKVTIAVYSNSGLVKKVIKFYRKKIKMVYLSEARPANEGREMAQYIADIGIDVVFSVDVLFPSLLSEVDFLLLGADSINNDRFINKIGSELLLKTARRRRVESAVIFESLKITKKNKSSNLKDDYNYREIWSGGKHKNISVINKYFEVIENRRVDIFISDLGIDTSQSLKKRLLCTDFL